MGVRASSYYDAHAQTVNLTEITSSDNNAEILRRLRDDDPKLAQLLTIQHDEDVFGEDFAFAFFRAAAFFAPGPACDGAMHGFEDFDIDIVSIASCGEQILQAVFVVVFIGEFEQWFIELL